MSNDEIQTHSYGICRSSEQDPCLRGGGGGGGREGWGHNLHML